MEFTPIKIVDKLLIEDSTIDGNPNVDGLAISDGDGINSVILMRSKFFGALAMSPRNLLIDNCEVIPPSTGHYPMGGDFTPFPIRAVTIRNTRVYNTGSVTYGWSNAGSPGNSLTVGSVSGTDILLTFSMAVAQSIEYGMTLTNTVTGILGSSRRFMHRARILGLRAPGQPPVPAMFSITTMSCWLQTVGVMSS